MASLEVFVAAFRDRDVVKMLYYIAVVLLELFYVLLSILFVAVFKQVCALLKEYDRETYD